MVIYAFKQRKFQLVSIVIVVPFLYYPVSSSLEQQQFSVQNVHYKHLTNILFSLSFSWISSYINDKEHENAEKKGKGGFIP